MYMKLDIDVLVVVLDLELAKISNGPRRQLQII